MLTALAFTVGLFAPAGTSKITFDVEPSNARIEVDGKVIRGTLIKVRPGKHSVRVSKAGYVTSKRTVTTKGGDGIKVKFRLKKRSKGSGVIANKRAAKPKGKAKPKVRRTPVGKKPGRTPIAGKPKAKPSSKPKPASKRRPVAKKPAKKGTTVAMTPPVKQPKKTKRPVKRRRPVGKRPVKKRPEGRRPVKRRPVARRPADGGVRPVTGGAGGGGVSDGAGGGGGTSTKPFAVLAFVVGGLAITGGVIAGLAADGAATDFNGSVDRTEKQKLKRDADNLALGSNIAYGVGATAVVLGAVLWAMDDTDDGYAWQAAPLPEGGAVVGIGGVF